MSPRQRRGGYSFKSGRARMPVPPPQGARNGALTVSEFLMVIAGSRFIGARPIISAQAMATEP